MGNTVHFYINVWHLKIPKFQRNRVGYEGNDEGRLPHHWAFINAVYYVYILKIMIHNNIHNLYYIFFLTVYKNKR